MSKRETYEAKTEALLLPLMEENGFELVDVEYVKEGSNYYLRAYIDKPEGINIDDCEKISRALNEQLDKEDFIEDSYILEVSSPGLLRPIKKPKDFERNMGKPIEVHLFKSFNGNKDYVGVLSQYDDEQVTIQTGEESLSFQRKTIASLRPYVEFDF